MGIAALRAALIVAAALAFFHAVPAASSPKRSHGRELVAQFDLPGDAVARYAALAGRASGSEPVAAIDHAMWVGPLQQVGVGRNPYTMVLTVNGVARTAGNSGARWQAGWEVRESPVATREVLMVVGAQAERETAAGAPVTLTAVSTPVSFRGDRQVSPMLNLVHADNLDIHDVHLQIWSGSAPLMAGWPSLAPPRPPLLALGVLCLLMGFFLRGTAHAPAAPRALNSRLPPAEVEDMVERPASTDRPAVALPIAAPAPQNQSSRVVDALRDVLLRGLAVPTELDDRHRRRAR